MEASWGKGANLVQGHAFPFCVHCNSCGRNFISVAARWPHARGPSLVEAPNLRSLGDRRHLHGPWTNRFILLSRSRRLIGGKWRRLRQVHVAPTMTMQTPSQPPPPLQPSRTLQQSLSPVDSVGCAVESLQSPLVHEATVGAWRVIHDTMPLATQGDATRG